MDTKKRVILCISALLALCQNNYNFQSYALPKVLKPEETLKDETNILRDDIINGKVFHLPNGYLIDAEGKLIGSGYLVDDNNMFEGLQVPLHPCLTIPGEFGYDENCGVRGHVVVYSRNGYDAYDLTGHVRKLNKTKSAPLLYFLPNWTNKEPWTTQSTTLKKST